MWVSVDLCIVPIGVGVSLSAYIRSCLSVIETHHLEYQPGPNGTAIEGEWDKVFECIKDCHEIIHKEGAPRIYTTLKVNTRIDKKQSFHEKMKSITN